MQYSCSTLEPETVRFDSGTKSSTTSFAGAGGPFPRPPKRPLRPRPKNPNPSRLFSPDKIQIQIHRTYIRRWTRLHPSTQDDLTRPDDPQIPAAISTPDRSPAPPPRSTRISKSRREPARHAGDHVARPREAEEGAAQARHDGVRAVSREQDPGMCSLNRPCRDRRWDLIGCSAMGRRRIVRIVSARGRSAGISMVMISGSE